MQKKLIALAVAGIMAAPMAANAGVEVYGKARLSVGVQGNDDTNTANETSQLAVSSHGSRMGFKGSEDLGGGLSAIWQVETGLDMDDKSGTAEWGTRNTFAGLSGSFGTVLLGVHDTPYKIATGNLDPWGDSYADYNAIIGTTHDTRISNVVAYVSPDMNGFSFIAAISPNAELAATDDNLPTTKNANDEATSLAAMYKNGPLFVSLAIQSVDNIGAGGDSVDGTKLGVGYEFGSTKLGFVYENDDQGGSNNDQDRLYFSVNQAIGDFAVKGGIGQADDRGNTTDSGATFFTVGGSKSLSKNVEVYALYASITNDAGATTAGAGDFNLDGVTAAGGNEAEASVLAVGLNMKFSSM